MKGKMRWRAIKKTTLTRPERNRKRNDDKEVITK